MIAFVSQKKKEEKRMKEEGAGRNKPPKDFALTAGQRREIEQILSELEAIRKQDVLRMMRMAGGRIVIA